MGVDLTDPRMVAARERANARPLRPCCVCGIKTTGNWCSTACHRADEPGAYDRGDD